jgi:hypothetical protein
MWWPPLLLPFPQRKKADSLYRKRDTPFVLFHSKMKLKAYACRPTRQYLLLIEQFTNKKGKKFTMIIILGVLCGDDVSQSPSSEFLFPRWCCNPIRELLIQQTRFSCVFYTSASNCIIYGISIKLVSLVPLGCFHLTKRFFFLIYSKEKANGTGDEFPCWFTDGF